jgi:KDO2-lipid IV(A) lauroyltransferase
MRALAALPLGLMLLVGRAIGRLARLLPLRYKLIARRNIALCLPELDRRQREELLDRHFETLGTMLGELAMTWWSSDERLDALSEIQGLEHLEAALARGRGAILLTAHFTSMQIGARILHSRHKINVLYRPLKNELLAHVEEHSFRRLANTIHPDNIRAMIAALKRNECVWYAADQSYRKKGARMVPFFGHPAATHVGTSRLAAMTGAAVLYYSAERLPGNAGWRGVIHPAFEGWGGADPVEDAMRYNACIERQVRTNPERYWWVHRRFKGLESDYPDYYRRDQEITRQQNG